MRGDFWELGTDLQKLLQTGDRFAETLPSQPHARAIDPWAEEIRDFEGAPFTQSREMRGNFWELGTDLQKLLQTGD